MTLSVTRKLILGRVLTRFGDQAWDFAIPLVLVKLFPGSLQIAAWMFLCLRIASLVLLPIVSSHIDRFNRMTMTRWGLLAQFVGVALAGIMFHLFQLRLAQGPLEFSSLEFIIPFLFLIVAGILGDQGAQIMDILISNDLAPAVIDNKAELTRFNTTMRRLDLIMEVSVPVMAGAILLLSPPAFPLFGFYLIVLWNLVSFIPEYLILRGVYRSSPHLDQKNSSFVPAKSICKNFKAGWDLYRHHPLFLLMVANSCLWLSALSPHGVLLTAFLKDGWSYTEASVGIFRSLGAAVGVLATYVFPLVIARLGFYRGALSFISMQFVTLFVSLIFFLEGSPLSQLMFLGLMLVSRIGMYGFTLGEVQFRQENIEESVRGRINGVAKAMNGLFNLGIFMLAAFLPQMVDFKYLVLLSVASIGVGMALTWRWYLKEYKQRQDLGEYKTI